MSILYFREQRFTEPTGRTVTLVHRLAVVFGLLMPLILMLAFLFFPFGRLFGVWPSLLIGAYEFTNFYGWAGLYLFGLLMILVPQLLEIEPDPKQAKWLDRMLVVYAAGAAAVIASAVLRVFYGYQTSFALLLVAGLGAECVSWFYLQYCVRGWFVKKNRPFVLHDFVQMAGMFFFSAGCLLNLVLGLALLWTQGGVFPALWIYSLRIMPFVGLALMVVSFIMRLVPEMLGWRPADDERLKRAYMVLLVSIATLAIAYTLFHYFGGPFSALLYALGVALALGGVTSMLWTADIWHVRLTASVNTEHVWYIYGSFAWLLLSVGLFSIISTWEIVHGAVIDPIWSEALAYAFFGGVVGLGLLGIYTYVINQLKSVYRHSDHLAVFAFIVFNWVFVMRAFILPFLQLSGWEGSILLRWVLEILQWLALAMISIDMYHGLFGHRWILAKKK